MSKLEQSAVSVKPATDPPSEHSNETESTPLIQCTERKQGSDTVPAQEEQISKPTDALTENAVSVAEPKEGNERDGALETNVEVTLESETNLVDKCRANEKANSDVVFKQEPVVPLRSRGEL